MPTPVWRTVAARQRRPTPQRPPQTANLTFRRFRDRGGPTGTADRGIGTDPGSGEGNQAPVTAVKVVVWRTLRILLTAAVVGVAGGCSSGTASGPTPPTTICQPAGGDRCAGPAPVQTWLYGPLMVAVDGLTLSGRFECGGGLEAVET
ncbi:MAG: hypothetical protein KGQ66_02595, partial [Acidobacteriota bacterium]|nr:hypothetical protein [Acidobacteriota bacterium]